MDSSSSSSSSKSSSSSHADVPVTKHEVFISFRGADIRDNFLSHLLKEFGQKLIDVYDDERLQRGEEISSSLLQAIEESSISLVILSEDYASSEWCMEELVKIIECMEQHQRIVIPVFYKVKPSHVRDQTGPLEKALGGHQERFKENMGMEQSWRSALQKVANLSGFHYPSKYKNESELSEKIVKDVSNKLDLISSSETNVRPIGIDEQIERIESLLAVELREETRMLGIWGMGGIGKTTIAEAVFHKYSSQYEGRCILRNVREESEKNGLHHLFRQLAYGLLQDENILLKGVSTEQIKHIKRRLTMKKVFIVLDDVGSTEQLEHLIGEQQICLGLGSRVIVTTRDEQILTSELVHEVYEVQKLNLEHSMQLFCSKAFSKTHPKTGYIKQSEKAVRYAKGVPLALRVLGSSLCRRSIEVWESALRKLELQLDNKIFNVLRLSYDGLDNEEKEIFLDIAFFFKGQDKDYVIRLLDSCDLCADFGIDNLVRKALISISKDKKIEMHDLIQQMGWKIVSEGPRENGSRLSNPKDVRDVLKYNKGTDLVKGIMWDLPQTKDLRLHVDTFTKMPKLRVLIAYGMPSNVYIPAELETFSDELRHLEWMGYPLKSLPSLFCAEKLFEFSLPFSKVTKLWDGVQELVNLEKINLWGCKQLVELPDFTKASKLREVHLTYCQSLRRVHPSILRTPTLEVLKLECCTQLKSLESEIQFEHLHELDVGGCSSLEEFSVMSEKIRSLDLSGSNIEVLNPSIVYLSKLERFRLSSLRIEGLPEVLCFLTSLVELDLSGCRVLIELPPKIRDLTKLTTLRIRDCFKLESLPELPSSITRLDATNCTSLRNCKRLDELSLRWFKEAAHNTMKGRANADLSLLASDDVSGICYPGSQVPEWFKYRTRQASVCLELDQPHRLLGLFLCCVTPPLHLKNCYEIKSQCYLGDGGRGGFEIAWRCVGVNQGLNSDHVYIWSDNDNEKKVLNEIKKYRANNRCTTRSLKISIEFIIIRRSYREGDHEEDAFTPVIKEGGVYPIYSQYWDEYGLIDENVRDVLRLIFDRLDDSERNIFLDIAFFFKGKDKDEVTRLLDSCGFFATSGIDNLLHTPLISLSEGNTIEMHYLIEQMACEIIRQESIEDPGKRSRLRNPEDVYDVLKNNRGTDSIEGIRLDLTKIKRDILLHVDAFKRMPKLRILQIVDDEILSSSKSYIAAELESFSDELRYLEWNRCPLRSLPSSFCAEKLVELRMPRSSQLTKLWDGVQDLVNLEIIDLQGCNQLVELPDFTLASKLRMVVLSKCSSLCLVHPSILCIPTLEVLRLDGCIKLKSLVGKIHFEYLHDLRVYCCDSLQEFSVTSKKIRSLNLRGTKIDVLHSSIGRLIKLETFRLSSKRIKRLPDELCLLTSLLELDHSGCREIIELPGNIKALTQLTTLRIRDCRGLQYLPELPSSITRLDATNCTSLNWTMFSFHDTLMRHAIIDCLNLLPTNTDKGFEGDDECDVCYPGSQVPEWFRYQTTKASSIYVELDQPLDQLLGFFLCCVSSMDRQYFRINPHCYLRDGERGRFKIKLRSVRMNVRLISDHVLIWCDHKNKLLDEIKQYKGNDLCTTNSQTISLEFVITDKVVEGCGIRPIYVSDIHNFIQKKDKEMGFDDKYKEYRQLVLGKLNRLGR